jgi:hypothetical protein
MWIMLATDFCGSMRDRVGQLGESGEYRTGRLRVTTRNMEIHDISSVMLQAGVTDVSYL